VPVPVPEPEPVPVPGSALLSCALHHRTWHYVEAVPKVSVITPVYDDGAYLAEALSSLAAQTFVDWEHLLVDDGSTDAATVALLDELERRPPPRTRVLRRSHGGVTRARNAALAEATGTYVTFFDADDRMRPAFLARTVATLEAQPSLGFASVWVRLFGDEEWDWKPEACDLVELLHDCSVATCALVRRSLVEGYDPSTELGHEDWDLWLSLVARGVEGTIVPELLFDYRRRGGSRSAVADRGETYLGLYRTRVAKHAASYRAHAAALLWKKERAVLWYLDERARQRRQLEALDATLAQRRIEVAGLRAAQRAAGEARAATAVTAPIVATAATAEASAAYEVEALRGSLSWRVTAPLRRIYERLGLGARGR